MPPNLIKLDHLEQQFHGDCLAVCAEMVLAYIGRPRSRKRLRRTVKIRIPYGTPFSKVRNLEQLGVTVRYEKGTIELLRKNVSEGHPCIVPVATKELPYWHEVTQHVVVVVGFSSDKIWLNDPMFSDSPTAVSFGDFDLAWFEMGEWFAVIEP